MASRSNKVYVVVYQGLDGESIEAAYKSEKAAKNYVKEKGAHSEIHSYRINEVVLYD